MDGSLGWHAMLRLADGRVIAGDAAGRRLVARAVLSTGRRAGLLVFRLADTHLHVVLMADRAVAGRFAQRVGVALHRCLTLPVAFAPTHFVPIRDQAHLRNTFRYVLGQEGHHGTAADPLHEGSSLPDLLGLRLLGAYTIDAVRRHLPRTARADLVAHLPADPVEADGVDRLAEAVDAVVAGGTGYERLEVQVAGAHAAGEGVRVEAVATALGVPPRTIHRWRVAAPRPALVRAVRLQLGLRRGVGGRVPQPAPAAPRVSEARPAAQPPRVTSPAAPAHPGRPRAPEPDAAAGSPPAA